jgi:xylose isomerase
MTVFSHIPPVRYEGPNTANTFAFRHYDKDRLVLGKRMEDHLRWAVCYWHTFHWGGTDIFGQGTFDRPWMPGHAVTQERADLKCEAAFDFIHRLGAPFYCWHDADAIADYASISEYSTNLAVMVDKLAAKQSETGVKLLWGTANLTGNPRYAAGAATNPDPEVFAWAAHQVRSMMDATRVLGGCNYVLWGGREGYDTVLNTQIEQELDQLGRFMTMVVEHKHKTGFEGTILIEPKPFEPAKHMYDRDTATVYGFLKRYGLENEIRVNIEANHATLAGNSFEHEVATATALGIFGSIDINRGDAQNGWDTDQFPNNVPDLTLTLYHILKDGGFRTGGFNFDAKVRRQSVDADDLFHAHIGGVDVLARALLAAAAIIEDGELDRFRDDRYAGWREHFGKKVLAGQMSLAEAADHAVQANADPRPISGRQEYLENLVNRFS